MKKQLENFVLNWLHLLTILQLKKNNPLIIGVTGSAGKTSTVKAIGVALATKYTVKYTHKGNSQTGIPFELLNIPVKNYHGIQWLKVIAKSIWQLIFYWPKYEIFVAEMGIDSDQAPKNMSYLLKLIKPKIGVFLNINHVHGQNFSGKDTLAAIAQEKGKLLTSLPKDGLAIYSADHPQILKLATSIQAPKNQFSIKQAAEIQLLKHQVSFNGTQFIFIFNNQQFILNLPHQVHLQESFGDFASAILIGKHLSVSTQTSIAALEKNFKLLPGRMSIIPGINNSIILDSSYNSSLEPTSAALKMLRQITIRGKRIAVLGDMREIGKYEKHDHAELARVAAKNMDEIILIGPLTTRYTLPQLKKLKFPQTQTHHFITAHEAITTLKNIIKPHDLILVKGSQNTIFLEIIVKAIMAQPEKAQQLLCRQTKYWEKQRRKLLNEN